jgi:hypothetical protein
MSIEQRSVSPDIPTQLSYETDGELSPAVMAHARFLLLNKVENAMHFERLTGRPSKFDPDMPEPTN